MSDSEPAAVIRLSLGHANGNVTTVGYPYEPGHDDVSVIRDADHASLSDHSQKQRLWLLSLPEEHQEYFIHLADLDNLWPHHSDHPPVWVSALGHPDLEQAVANHFSTRGHECVIGDPNAVPVEQPVQPPEVVEE